MVDVFEALDNKDERPGIGGWAPGNYTNACTQCHIGFVGDKRASVCADCAYGPNDKKGE